MKLPIIKINKFLIASILFVQLSGLSAQFIFESEDSFINLCTQYGIKKIPVSDQDVNKEIQDVNQVMHCCLDVQSNFVLIKQNFLVERKILFAFAEIDKDTYKKQYPNNYSLIRAPPNLAKI